mmetsp:Transcript_13149/g.27761  ORF Transcript_13149/g.27761 Transcript_13149/m.27761 type:complete len:90 (-) Transcript_13149:1378-1647(-)
MGRFDRKSKLEKEVSFAKSKKKGKRQQFTSVAGSDAERRIMEDAVRRIVSQGAKPTLNVSKAVKQVDPRSLRIKKAKTPKKKRGTKKDT